MHRRVVNALVVSLVLPLATLGPGAWGQTTADEPALSDWLDPVSWIPIGICLALIGYFIIYRHIIRPARLRRRLMAVGLSGTARIDRVRDTGSSVNDNPVVLYECWITPAGGAPYRASTRMVVSRLSAPAAQVGSRVDVRIDPKNPKLFIIV
jgi:hypothetical protein